MNKTLTERIRQSTTLKLIGIITIVLLLLIPVAQVRDIIDERQALQFEAAAEISNKWGHSQLLSGPILSIPYDRWTTTPATLAQDGSVIRKETREAERRYFHVLPDQLRLNGQLDGQTRYRGIYKAILYESTMDISGEFDIPMNELPVDADQMKWDEATVNFGLSDLRGIQNEVEFSAAGRTHPIRPGVPNIRKLNNGFHFAVPIDERKQFAFNTSIDLNGSERINFVPIGKTTEVSITSNWPNPSFSGQFLPDQREISDSGFTANWKVLDINRNYPQTWNNYVPDLAGSSFGLGLIDGLDTYQKSTRAIKYAFMIIALTFTVFFFFEILKQLRIHPIQYVIVGIALVVFYTLLIALSEHIAFGLAYAVSVGAVLLITTLYFRSISGSWANAFTFFGILGSIMVFIYTLLNMEQYSLLLGAIGLFAITAIVMFVTRNVNWYKIGSKAVDAASPPPDVAPA